MKKLFTAIMASAIMLTGTIQAQASEHPTNNSHDTNDYESFNLTDEQAEILNQYEKSFIKTGMYKEFSLNTHGALTTDKSFSDLQEKYNVSDDDIRFISNFIQMNQTTAMQISNGIGPRMTVKNFRVYLTYKETNSFLGTVVTSGPIAVIGALAALGMTVGGPAGAVISGVAGIYGASHVVTVTRKAINQKKGVWIGWGGIGIN